MNENVELKITDQGAVSITASAERSWLPDVEIQMTPEKFESFIKAYVGRFGYIRDMKLIPYPY
jgi:hypothetical protein